MEVNEEFKKEILGFLDKYRLAGYDVEVSGPSYVPLEIEVTVSTDEYHYKDRVEKELTEAFGNQDLPDGRRGFFHPDNLTFGQAIFLSRIYEIALRADGIRSMTVSKFKRRGRVTDELDRGWIDIGTLEIARLDNDPNFPENGTIKFNVRGGK